MQWKYRVKTRGQLLQNLRRSPCRLLVRRTYPPQTEEETAEMAEGLDLASRAVGEAMPEKEEHTEVAVSEHTTQEEPSASTKKRLITGEEQDRYLQERKRKGKSHVKPKQSTKKARKTNTGIVIREPEQGSRTARREDSDKEYYSSEEPDSEDDVYLDDEEYHERQLPENHQELIHPQ